MSATSARSVVPLFCGHVQEMENLVIKDGRKFKYAKFQPVILKEMPAKIVIVYH